MKILKEVAQGTIPPKRLTLLKLLFNDRKNSWKETSVLAKGLDCPVTTAKYALEELLSLKMVEQRLNTNNHYEWRLSNKCKNLIKKSSIFS